MNYLFSRFFFKLDQMALKGHNKEEEDVSKRKSIL